METKQLVTAISEFYGKFKINENYRPIAEALVEKFEELKHVPVKNILFVENLEDKRKKNNSVVYAQISKVPGKWEDIVYQLTGRQFDFMLEIFKENTLAMSREQIIALIYHELRHIQLVATKDSSKIDLVGHDIEDWTNMVEKLGVDWNVTQGVIPDLLADGVDWESIEGPANLFPAETTLRVVK